MTNRQPSAAELFGTNVVALPTPMRPDLSISEPDLVSLVERLVSTGCDGLVVAGTTGESPTLSEEETAWLVRRVATHAKRRARVIAGIGTYDTAASVRRARAAEAAGADALLLVCPYYSRPTQAGVVAHCVRVADATKLPVMLYDIPARAGIAMAPATLLELAGHPRIRAVKDAKGDLAESMSIMSRTALAYYCGLDELNLAYLACGATGVVSVIGNVVGDRVRDLITAVRCGDLNTARAINTSLTPVVDEMLGGSQGAVMAKAALAGLGVIGHASVRPPLLEASSGALRRLNATVAGALEPSTVCVSS